MSDVFSRTVLIGALIFLLHLPLIFFVFSLHARLLPGQGVSDLGPFAILTLLVLTLLPYVTPALFNIEWNPQRARLGEYDS